jgi:hypothetical protein
MSNLYPQVHIGPLTHLHKRCMHHRSFPPALMPKESFVGIQDNFCPRLHYQHNPAVCCALVSYFRALLPFAVEEFESHADANRARIYEITHVPTSSNPSTAFTDPSQIPRCSDRYTSNKHGGSAESTRPAVPSTLSTTLLSTFPAAMDPPATFVAPTVAPTYAATITLSSS